MILSDLDHQAPPATESTPLGTIVSELLAAQRADGHLFDSLLAQSNRALDAGQLASANRYGDAAQDVLARIRHRSHQLAQLVESSTAVAR
jgi:hypothetical protein